MLLTELRVLTLHINSYSFRARINTVREIIREIFTKALWSQVDLITGDANLCGNRQSLNAVRGNKFGGIIIEALEDVISICNEKQVDKFRITSTGAAALYQKKKKKKVQTSIS